MDKFTKEINLEFDANQKDNEIDIKTIALQFRDRINGRDIERLTGLMTEDHVLINMENDRTEGIDNLYIEWKMFFMFFSDYRSVVERVVVKGSKVIMQGYSVCSDDRFNNLHAIWVAEVRDNKISLWHIYPDTEENRTFLDI
jgi:ketosteroid isomerase-like protein